jgi:DNA-binding CsgD family transcriptional regulator
VGPEAEQLSCLIADIYDAALESALWPTVLERCAHFVGGFTAALISKGSDRTFAVHFEDGNFPAEATAAYRDKYVKFDPSTTAMLLSEACVPVTTLDYISFDELTHTRFYQEWVRVNGLGDSINVVLDKSPSTAAMAVVFRNAAQGLADDGARRRMALIAPHLRRAVCVARLIDSKTAENAAFTDTFNVLSAAMLLVDSAGRVMHANAAGVAMLIDGGVLRAPGGRLMVPIAEGEALLEAIRLSGGEDAALGDHGVAVPLADSDGERYVAHVMPLTSRTRRRAGLRYAASAALFIHKAALQMPSAPEVIAKTFKLTPGELRVLLAIVQTGGVAVAAEALGVSEATIRTHLQHLFAKTGTSRQADLVKLVAGFASPLLK